MHDPEPNTPLHSLEAGQGVAPRHTRRRSTMVATDLDCQQKQRRRSVDPTKLAFLLFCAGIALLLVAIVGTCRHLHDVTKWRDLGTSDWYTSPHKLLLASHGRLFWYNYLTQHVHVLHEGEGVHYGFFPGVTNNTVWVVVRPHNWHPTSTKEHLLELDSFTGKIYRRVQINSRFTHDAVRREDSVYLCNTGEGQILELAFPSMRLKRTMPLFTLKDHVNTLAPLSATELWLVLHNLGQSDAVKVDLSSTVPSEVERVTGVGEKAHGLVSWQERFVMLDSDSSALIVMDPHSGEIDELWKVPEEGKFLKGLCVVDDTAFFGISTSQHRAARDDRSSHSELAAFDLIERTLLWRRQVPTHGLLNIVGAPHLAVGSTYAATFTRTRLRNGLVAPDSDATVAQLLRALDQSQRNRIGGYWSSGRPFLERASKGTDTPWQAGYMLPLFKANVSALQSKIAALPEEMWHEDYQKKHNILLDGRADNMKMFKEGVESMFLIFSDNSGENVYEFPFFKHVAEEVNQMLEEIFGRKDRENVIRLQLARMKPGVEIKIHQDMGGYAKIGHRVHVPITTHPDVMFEACVPVAAAAAHAGDADVATPDPPRPAPPSLGQLALARRTTTKNGRALDCLHLPMAEGLAFELNNRIPHRVTNDSPITRVHLVIDVIEDPRTRTPLAPGTKCVYERGVITCRT